MSDVLFTLNTVLISGIAVIANAVLVILQFILAIYLLRIARWYVQTHNIPRLFSKSKKESAK